MSFHVNLGEGTCWILPGAQWLPIVWSYIPKIAVQDHLPPKSGWQLLYWYTVILIGLHKHMYMRVYIYIHMCLFVHVHIRTC